jgi:hypothetical protein
MSDTNEDVRRDLRLDCTISTGAGSMSSVGAAWYQGYAEVEEQPAVLTDGPTEFRGDSTHS